MKKRFATYTDGVLWVCEQTVGRSDFGAVKNAREGSDIKQIEKLNYQEMSKRDQDQDFASSQGRTLSMKVRCLLRPWVTKLNIVKIDETLYSIINVDFDRANRVMYMYLEEVRKL
jgi:hypothetical protein